MKNIRKASAFHQNWWYKPLSIVNPHKPSKIGGFSPRGIWFSISYQMVRWKPLPIGWLVYPHGSPWVPIAFMVNLRGCYYWIYQYRGSCDKPILLYCCFTIGVIIGLQYIVYDKPIAMLAYPNCIYQLAFHIDIYLLLVYYQRSTVRFLRSAVPTPFPGRHGRQGTAEAETSLDFCLAKSSYWEQKNGGGSGFLPCFNGVPFLNQLRHSRRH